MTRKGASRKASRQPLAWSAIGLRILTLLKWGLLLSISAAMLWYGNLGFERWMAQPVQQVVIHSRFERVTRAEIETTITSAIDRGFMQLELTGIQQTLTEQPWIDEAVVKRQWPGIIDVTVIEHRPIARWGSVGVLNQRGEFIPLDDQALTTLNELPLLSGPQGMEHQVMVQYQHLNQLFQGQQRSIRELICDASRSWSMEFDDGVSIELGRHDLEQRIQRFLKVYELELHARWSELVRIDLRYFNGLAVKWREQEST